MDSRFSEPGASSNRAGSASAPAALTLYEKLTNEEDARACRDISDAACRESPGNFLFILLSQFLTKLGDALASPKTVLAWTVTAVGAPAAVLALLVPVRESGSLVPQLVIGSFVRRLGVRKWVWVGGSVLQALALSGIAAVVWSMSGPAAGWAILGLLALFSLARGLCSVASKDVLGKTIPKGQRGQLTGWSAGLAGLVSIGVGLVLLLPDIELFRPELLALLLACAGCLWLVAAATFALVREYPGETDGGNSAMRVAFSKLGLLISDGPFRRFVIVRALLLCSALSAPFYVALAQERIGSPAALLGAFVIAAGLASLLSAPFWGRFADRSSRAVMTAAGCVTAAAGVVVFTVSRWWPELLGTFAFLPAAYLVLGIAHSGVRVGRKTYVVDLGSGNRRTDYVALSNTVIGVALLLVGALGSLAELLGNAGVIGLLALMGALGAGLSTTLQEA